MHFGGPGGAHHFDDLDRGRAAHDGVVDQHHTLAFEFAQVGVVLEADAQVPDLRRGLDKRAPECRRFSASV